MANSAERGDAPFKRELQRGDVVQYKSHHDDNYYMNGAIAVILGPDVAQQKDEGYRVVIVSAKNNPNEGDEDEDWVKAPYFWARNIGDVIGHIEVPADE